MGNQCCGNNNDRIDGEMAFTSTIPVNQTRKLQVECTRLHSVMQSKEDNQEIGFFNQDVYETFILSLKPYNPLETTDSIELKLKIRPFDFSYKSESDLQIDEDVIIDPNNFETSIVKALDQKSGQKHSLKIINFDDYEDYIFKQALYEIYIMQQIQNAQQSDYLIKMKEAYILENEDKDNDRFSLIILMEECDTTLHEIIAFRRFHDWKWSPNEISAILLDLASAIGQMEQLGLVHRDIRPHNIWYSTDSKKYKISGFQDAKLIKKPKQSGALVGLSNVGIVHKGDHDNNMLNTVRGVPDYLAPEVAKYLSHQQQVGKYDPFLSDIYQLGLCLSMMVYLANDVQDKEVSEFIHRCQKDNGRNHRNIASKSYIDLIKLMLIGDDSQRLSPAELQLFVTSLKSQVSSIDESNVVKSMRFKKKLVGPDATRVYRLIAQYYYQLFEWERWQEKMEEVFVTYEKTESEAAQAEILYEIAQGFMDIKSIHNAFDYFMRASVIYNEAGHSERQKGNLDNSLEQYKVALDCVRKANQGEDSYEGALLLENLGNAFRMKGDSKKARAYIEESQSIVAKEKGEESLENAKLLIAVAKIYISIADYSVAMKRVKKSIKILEGMKYQYNFKGQTNQNSGFMQQSFIQGTQQQTDKQAQLLKASALQVQGEIERLTGKLSKAKKNFEEALRIRQTVQGNAHLDVASNIESLGNVFFEMEDFHQAATLYEKALVIKKCKLGESNDEIAITLNNLGNTCKHMGEVDKAQKFFTDALGILQHIHGKEQNQLIGTTYGNLGILLKDQGNKQGAEHCLKQCVEILNDNMDAAHPDQQFYRDHLSQVV